MPVAGNLLANSGEALVAAAVRGQGIIYRRPPAKVRVMIDYLVEVFEASEATSAG